MTDTSDAQVIADLADIAHSREAFEIIPGRLAGVMLPNTEGPAVLQTFVLNEDAPPAWKTGHVTLTEPGSFHQYVNRHKVQSATTLWGDDLAGRVTAVIDDHFDGSTADGGALFGKHRATLFLQTDADWQHWVNMDSKLMEQTVFAEHLELGATNIVRPTAADMMELAQSFHAKKDVNFKSSRRLDNGEVQFQYEEEAKATAGLKGQLEIPVSFLLNLTPFIGATETYVVEARFRYRLNNGDLTMGYKLVRPDVIVRQAFKDITDGISDTVGLPVFSGTPRS